MKEIQETQFNKLLNKTYLTLVLQLLSRSWTNFDTLYLLVTSQLTPSYLVNVDQKQIIFKMAPKCLFWRKKITMGSRSRDPVVIRK